jgi:crossover junction endodeoxyribonuclease RuvC
MATVILLGIDPGANGAIAVFQDGKLIDVLDMPVVQDGKGKRRTDAAAVGAVIREVRPQLAVVERVGAMPGQGVTSMFSFGLACGIVHGALGALEVPMELVTPQQWKQEMHVGRDNARQRASQLLPAGSRLWPLVKHDGRAEAALIGLWAIMKRSGTVLW